jgi:hypothetical protein
LGPEVFQFLPLLSLLVLNLLTGEGCVSIGVVKVFIVVALLFDDFFYNIVQTSIVIFRLIVFKKLEIFLNLFLLIGGDRA